MFHLRNFIFNDPLKQIIPGSTRPIFTQFSPYRPNRYLMVDKGSCRLFPIAQETLPWQPIRSIRLHSLPWRSKTDGRVNSLNDLATSCKNYFGEPQSSNSGVYDSRGKLTQYLLDRFSPNVYGMEVIWSYIKYLTFFSRLFKGCCHGSQFLWTNWANFVYFPTSVAPPLRNELHYRNADFKRVICDDLAVPGQAQRVHLCPL